MLPSKLAEVHKNIIRHFTGDGSMAMNNFLRNKLDNGNRRIYDTHANGTSNIEHHIDQLSSAFTPENTNREHAITFSDIPENAAKKLMDSKPGSRHMIAGFTSTSTEPGIADTFAKRFAEKRGSTTRHVMSINLHPGVGLSAHDNSAMPHEQEIILNHGAHIVYHGSHELDNGDGTTTVIHHVSALPTHTHYTHFEKLNKYS